MDKNLSLTTVIEPEAKVATAYDLRPRIIKDHLEKLQTNIDESIENTDDLEQIIELLNKFKLFYPEIFKKFTI